MSNVKGSCQSSNLHNTSKTISSSRDLFPEPIGAAYLIRLDGIACRTHYALCV